jgi:hypothetical protein
VPRTAPEPQTSTGELAALFSDAATAETAAISTSDSTATQPLPRNADRAAFLRRAGLPDQI